MSNATRKARYNPRQVKDAVLRGRIVEASSGWMIRINNNDMVELWPPGDHDGYMTHIGHLDRVVADFCKKADMPIPKVNETQGDQVKLPGDAQSLLGPDSDSKEPKGKFDPEINQRPKGTDQKGTSKPDTSLGPDSTNKGLKSFDPAINKRPRPNIEEGGLPDTSLGSDTSGAPTNWHDKKVRIEEDGRNRFGRRRGQTQEDVIETLQQMPGGRQMSGLGERLQQLMENFQTSISVEDNPDGTVHLFDARNDMVVDPFIAISELQRLPVDSDEDAVWDALSGAFSAWSEEDMSAVASKEGLHEPQKPKRGPGQLGVGKAQMGEEAPQAAPGVAARRKAEEDPFKVRPVEEPGKKLNKGENPSDPEEVISQSKGEKKELREETEGKGKMGIRDSFEDATPDPTAIYQDLRRARPSEDLLRDIMDPQKWAANNIFLPTDQAEKNQRRAQMFEEEEPFDYDRGDLNPEHLYDYIQDLKRAADESGNDAMFEHLRMAEQAMESGDYGEAFDHAEEAEQAFDEEAWKVAYRRHQGRVVKFAQWALGEDTTSEAIAYLVDQGYDELAASEIINAYLRGDTLDFQSAYLAEEALGGAAKAARRIGQQSEVTAEEDKEAVAPKGWEKTVKEMKDEPGIDNPWALSWWMKDKGYTPGGSEETKKKEKKSRRTAGPKLKENWSGDGSYGREIGAESAEELHALTMALGGEEVDWSKFKPAQPEGAPVEEQGVVDEQSAEQVAPVQASRWEDEQSPFDDDVQPEPGIEKSLDSSEPSREGRRRALTPPDDEEIGAGEFAGDKPETTYESGMESIGNVTDINYERFGPGKFDDNVQEFLYAGMLDGWGEDLGDEGFGVYTFLDLGEPVTVHQDGDEWSFAAAILHEDTNGFVYTDYFDTSEEGAKAWAELEKDYEDFLDEYPEWREGRRHAQEAEVEGGKGCPRAENRGRSSMPDEDHEAACDRKSERAEKEAVDPEAEQYWEGYMGDYGKQLTEGDTGKPKPDTKDKGKKKDKKKADLNDPGYQKRKAAYLRARREAQAGAPLAEPTTPAPTPAPGAPPAGGAPAAPPAPAGPAKPEALPPGSGDSGLQALGWTAEDIALLDEEDKKKILQIQLNKPGTKKKPLTPGEKPGVPEPKAPTPPTPAAPAPGGVPKPMTPAARQRLAKLILRKVNRRKLLSQAAPEPAAPMTPAPPTPDAGAPGAAPPTPPAGAEATLPEFDAGDGSSEEERALQLLSDVQEMEVSATTPEQVPSLKASFLARKLLTELGMTVQDAKKLYGLGSQRGLTSLFE